MKKFTRSIAGNVISTFHIMKSIVNINKLLLISGFWLLSAVNALGQTPTTTTLTSGTNPQCAIFDVTFTAVIDPSGATGTVEFLDGATVIGTGTISGGTATYTTSSLSSGTHTITAHYLGTERILKAHPPHCRRKYDHNR